MADTASVRVAAVGLGWVTINRHIPALRRAPNVRLVGVVDHQSGRAERLARQLGLPLVATAQDAGQVPWIDQVDAVTIGTPPDSHHRLVSSFLAAGKDVLVEKPMAMTPEEADQLVALAASNGRVLGVVHNFQFTRSVRRAMSLMADGNLGDIRTVWATQLSNPLRRLPVWYEQLPLGLFYDESPHFFYLLRSLTHSEPQFVSVNVLPSREGTRTPHKITALLDGEGIPIQLDMNFQAPLSEWHIALLGTKRAAIIDLFRDICVVLPNDHSHRGRDILRTSGAAGWAHTLGTIQSGTRAVAGRLSYGTDEVIRKFALACLGNESALSGIAATDGAAVVAMQHHVVVAAK